MYRQKRNFDSTQKKNSVSRDVKNALEVIRLLRELYVRVTSLEQLSVAEFSGA